MFSQLLFFSLLPLTLAGSRLRVVHRVYLPLGGPVPFAERGTLHITDDGLSAEFTPSKTIGQDLQHFANVLHDISPDGALYQVGLERGGDMSFWDISSVKAVSRNPSYCTTGRASFLHGFLVSSSRLYRRLAGISSHA